MSKPIRQCAVVVSLLLLCVALAGASFAQAQAPAPPAPPDSTLFTSYFTGAGYQNVTWIVCGSTQQSSGCYGAGGLGPFGRAGAMLEGNQFVSGSTVTRAIYVVDIASGTSGTGVTLYVYKKTDTVSASTDTISVTLTRKVNLPLTGGATALCSMAADNGFLFIGTDQSSQAVRVQKSNLAITTIGGFSPPINVSSITADKYGYVTVTFGSFTTGENGFVQFDPNGNGIQDGGGAWFMLNTSTGLSTTTLPTSDAFPSDRLIVRPKQKQD